MVKNNSKQKVIKKEKGRIWWEMLIVDSGGRSRDYNVFWRKCNDAKLLEIYSVLYTKVGLVLQWSEEGEMCEHLLKGPKHDQVGYEFFLHKADTYG